jgi:predicted  nucleic acid-binding Zn-ribbon protein
MEPTINFPRPEPELKLARPSAEKWAATLAEERRRLQEDQESLREREDNLREYEARLRALQADIDAGRSAVAPVASGTTPSVPTRSTPPLFHRPSSHAPFHEDPSLQAAWEKLHRAREILEAEQKNLRDDRIALREMETNIKRREEELALREARLAEREALVAAAAPAIEEEAIEERSAVSRLTRAPLEMARSVFGGKR